jgi:hypothetical protein
MTSRSCTLRVAELDSIRIIARQVLIRENIYILFYFIIFSLPNIYIQIRPSGIVIGDATTNVALATPSPA